MKKRELVSRLRGFTVAGLGGVTFEPRESDRAVARRVLAMLEGRRVLFAPAACEVPEHCVTSVMEIRTTLSEELGKPLGDGLRDNLRALRSACLRFLVAVDGRSFDPGTTGSWILNQAIGELRGAAGTLVATIALTNDLDVDEPLSIILPPDPDEDDLDWFPWDPDWHGGKMIYYTGSDDPSPQ